MTYSGPTGQLWTIDEFVRDVRRAVRASGRARSAVPEQHGLLRRIPLVEVGYMRRLGVDESAPG